LAGRAALAIASVEPVQAIDAEFSQLLHDEPLPRRALWGRHGERDFRARPFDEALVTAAKRLAVEDPLPDLTGSIGVGNDGPGVEP
jgi:hypothetical protein